VVLEKENEKNISDNDGDFWLSPAPLMATLACSFEWET
jgi:hypothetical protein